MLDVIYKQKKLIGFATRFVTHISFLQMLFDPVDPVDNDVGSAIQLRRIAADFAKVLFEENDSSGQCETEEVHEALPYILPCWNSIFNEEYFYTLLTVASFSTGGRDGRDRSQGWTWIKR